MAITILSYQPDLARSIVEFERLKAFLRVLALQKSGGNNGGRTREILHVGYRSKASQNPVIFHRIAMR